jgi:hypothetical protein
VTVPLETLVAELRTLSKKIGSLTTDALTDTPCLTSLPRYLDYSVDQIRRETFLADLEEAVAGLPDEERGFARLLFSYDAPGTNITHRRKLAGMGTESKPSAVTKWREHYIFALIASRLMAAAGRSRHEDSGPGYRHNLIISRTTHSADDPRYVTLEWIYDILITRDGTYVYLVGDRTRLGGEVVAPWQVTSGHAHVGDVSFERTASDGAAMHVIYLGRRYARDETARITTSERRFYETLKPEDSASVQTGRFPSPLLIEVSCPREIAPAYQRIEYEDNSVNAAPREREDVVRVDDESMTYKLTETRPLTRYALNWTMLTAAL